MRIRFTLTALILFAATSACAPSGEDSPLAPDPTSAAALSVKPDSAPPPPSAMTTVGDSAGGRGGFGSGSGT